MTGHKNDVYYADLSPVIRSERGGIRPVLVIQNDIGNKASPMATFDNDIIRQLIAQVKVENADDLTIILHNGYKLTAQI